MGDCDLLRRVCPRSFIAPFLQRRVRPDGRRLWEARPFELHAAGLDRVICCSKGDTGDTPVGPPLAAAHASAAVRAGADWWFAAVECKLGPPVPLPPPSSSNSSSSSSSSSSSNDDERWGGKVLVSVEMPRICGCPSEDTLGTAREVSRHLTALFNNPDVFNCSQLKFNGDAAAAAAEAAAAAAAAAGKSTSSKNSDSNSSSNSSIDSSDSSSSSSNDDEAEIKFYWHIDIRIACIQSGGSVVRAAALAAVAALSCLRLPDVEWDPQRKWWAFLPPPSSAAAANSSSSSSSSSSSCGVVRGKRVVLNALPVSLTACHVLESTWVLDPTEEERQLGPTVDFLSIKEGDTPLLHKLQGPPLDPVLLQQLQTAAAQALEDTRKQLAEAISI